MNYWIEKYTNTCLRLDTLRGHLIQCPKVWENGNGAVVRARSLCEGLDAGRRLAALRAPCFLAGQLRTPPDRAEQLPRCSRATKRVTVARPRRRKRVRYKIEQVRD